MQFFHVFVNFVDVFAVYQKGFVRFACYVFPYVITTHGKHFVIDSHSYVCLFVCFWRVSPLVGQGLLVYEVSRSHTTHHSR